MTGMTKRLIVLRRIAIACAILVLAITSLSAFIRLSRAGLGCAPWPQCYVQQAALSPQALDAADAQTVRAARIAHRVAASAALLLVIALLMKSMAQQPVLPHQGRLALALLGVALLLAVLGRMAGDSRSAAVILGNLLGGFALFALSCRMVQCTSAPGSGAMGSPRLRPWIIAALVLLSLQVALGALASGAHVADRCGESAWCDVHRVGAIATVAVLVPLGVLAWRAGQRFGAAVVALVVAQAALGLLIVANAAPLALALAHNVLGALLLAALVALLPPRTA